MSGTDLLSAVAEKRLYIKSAVEQAKRFKIIKSQLMLDSLGAVVVFALYSNFKKLIPLYGFTR